MKTGKTNESVRDVEEEMHGQVEEKMYVLNTDLGLHTIPSVMAAR